MTSSSCAQCGAALRPDSRFCPSCGATTPAPSAPSAPQFQAGEGGTTADARGFFAALFDFSFTSFITTKLIRVLYILSVILIGLGALGFLIAGLAAGAGPGIATLIFAPLGFLVYVIITRVWLEVIMVLFRIADHTREIAEQGRTQPRQR